MRKRTPEQKQKRKKRRRITLWVILSLLAVILLGHGVFFIRYGVKIRGVEKENPNYTAMMAWSHAEEGNPPTYISLSEIPLFLQQTVIYTEDGRYFFHKGVDMAQMYYAMRINLKYRRIVYGASTITMQTARTLFLGLSKTYWRKYKEVLIALLMERILSKQRIVELYLNYAEWGTGIYGISDAADHYYSKTPLELSEEEQAALITIMASPLKYSVDTWEQSDILIRRHEAVTRVQTNLKKRAEESQRKAEEAAAARAEAASEPKETPPSGN